jgi:ribA/ribD-fused uncharacterized protein
MILQLSGEFWFMSNFYEAPVRFQGITWPSVEHAYQAMKTDSWRERDNIGLAASPSLAKKIGRGVRVREDWDNIKIDVMNALVRAKFSQNAELRQLLVGTEDEIMEGNTWGDTFWGVMLPTGGGRNELGKILMKVREELRWYND